jgi:hypothetical protein
MKFPVYFFFLSLLISTCCYAQTNNAGKAAGDSVMITIFLKHQQDKNLKEIQKVQEANKLWEIFPPKEARVVSWYVMMGIGQVVTVKIPAHALRTLNLSIENGAWGAFDTEFYPTYDYKPIWQNSQKNKK